LRLATAFARDQRLAHDFQFRVTRAESGLAGMVVSIAPT